MNVYTLGLIGAAGSLAVIFEMLRRRRLREKYAVVWVVVGLLIVIVAIFPRVLFWAAEVTGVEVPANLLFFVASLVLLGVNVHLSSEVGQLEDRVRTLAEELALQRLKLDHLSAKLNDRPNDKLSDTLSDKLSDKLGDRLSDKLGDDA